MNAEDANELIERYFLGTISEQEMERLDQQLQDDPSLRELFRATARLDTNLREAAFQSEDENESEVTRVSFVKSSLVVGVAAAAVLMLGVFLLLWPHDHDSDHIATVVEVGGSLRWTGDGGEVRERLTASEALSGGTLESLSADSWVEIAFLDGSKVALSGQSSVTFSQGAGGKVVRLREGNLSAKVSSPRQDKAMRFITPTAEAKVLGAQLTLRADASTTKLTVYEGRVRVTRLADGSVQDVPANHFVVAALDTGEAFLAQRRAQYVDTWKSKLPYGIGHGEWHPRDDDAPGSLEAKPLLWREYGRNMVLYLAAFTAIDAEHRVAILKETAHIRIVGRLAEEGEVHFGLTTHPVGGGFAGKYIASRQLGGSDEPFLLDLPITAFNRQYPCFPESLIGHELIDWWALTINKDAGLEIVSVELLAP